MTGQRSEESLRTMCEGAGQRSLSFGGGPGEGTVQGAPGN